MMINTLRRTALGNIAAYLLNMIMAYVAFMICRIVYVAINWTSFHEGIAQTSWNDLLSGSLLFDTSALLYLNALYLLLMLLPLHLKENARYHRIVRIVFLVFNGIGIIANLADSVYFPFTGRRTTATVFNEFSNEGNLGDIVGTELLHSWYLVLLFVLMIWALYKLYVLPCTDDDDDKPIRLRTYYPTLTAALLVMAGLTVAGMRGGFTTAVRPITISNANQYVSRPTDAAIVLNTPFSIIRTLGKKTFVDPGYFSTQEEPDAIFTPEHYPADSATFVPRNVVVIIVESLGREYIGALNDMGQCGDNYRGYTPFIDELCHQSFTTDWSFANGRKSIDAMPSILSGIPMFVEPFFLTSASLNEVGGLARSLGGKGYQTAFFHGAQNGSMGFQAFSRATGFDAYYGRTEFDADPDFNGENDFDGTWAIWDEPFLQFYGKKMSEMSEPFMTTVFTASSHHPFAIPEQYRDTFPDEGIAMHKCIRYLDHALHRFFERVSREPWYDRTLFVITGDHTNLTDQAYYQTDLGYFGSPFILFDPTGTLVAPQRRHAIAQQIDVMPTVLSALHFDEPYVAFGCDLLTTPDHLTWAINYSGGIYQYVEDGYLLQFDGQQPRALYDILGDWYQTRNLKDDPSAQSILNTRLQRTKAIIQSYMQRMVNDSLVIKNP